MLLIVYSVVMASCAQSVNFSLSAERVVKRCITGVISWCKACGAFIHRLTTLIHPLHTFRRARYARNYLCLRRNKHKAYVATGEYYLTMEKMLTTGSRPYMSIFGVMA